MDDLTLLRKFEPVVRYTQGELFSPCAVDEYVRHCSLWLRDDNGNEHQLLVEGELSVEKLGHYKEVPANHTLYLRFVQRPLEALEYQRWLRRPNRPSFSAPGRLARVGLFPRILSSLFDLSLAIRGTVPGGTTAAADIKFQDMVDRDSRYVYYGRVNREGGYIILHYLFFFTMNDWRSSFYGVNDHEADWEQILVYLSDEGDGEAVPRWAAYASHDFSGDDLRRRWDDPELHIHNETHPVIYAGAGSHASYFEPGEYLLSIEPAFLMPLKNGLIMLRKFWAENLGQGSVDDLAEEVGALLSVPFVDYARGDGLCIGPGQTHSWSPIILSEDMGWVENYRGLWGLDTQDPLGGERAPAGPKYNRDGSVRTVWYDPLGWAGLNKVTPPNMAPSQLKEYIATLIHKREAIAADIVKKREEVRLLTLEVQALQQTDYLTYLFKKQAENLEVAQNELQALYTRSTELTETLEACRSNLQKIEQGDWGDPQAHIHHKHPVQPPLGEQARFVELWAAISGGLMLLISFGLVILFPRWWFGLTILVVATFVTIEATIRGQLPNLLLNVTIVLAIVTSLVLIWEFWWLLLLIMLVVIVFVMIRENLRELWSI